MRSEKNLTSQISPPTPHRRFAMSTQYTIDALRNQLQHWSAKHHKPGSHDIISTGCAEFDSLLPKGGFVPGQLVEWLGAWPGSGAQALSWIIAMQSISATQPVATTVAQTIVVVDREGDFYPSAAIAWGIKSEQIMIVRPKHLGDTLWVIDQALRCSAVAAVWTSLEQIDSSHFRRMQLAAEEGSTLGLLVRPATGARAAFVVGPAVAGRTPTTRTGTALTYAQALAISRRLNSGKQQPMQPGLTCEPGNCRFYVAAAELRASPLYCKWKKPLANSNH